MIIGSFVRPESLSYYDHTRQEVSLTVGDATYVVPPLDEGLVIRIIGLSKGQQMAYRRPKQVRTGLKSLRIKLRSGKFVARVQPDDLNGLRVDGNWGVPVELRIGACVFRSTIDLDTRTTRRGLKWLHRSRRTPAPLPFDGRGRDGKIDAERTEIVRDQQAWEALWAELTGRSDPPPAVDFATEMVVVVGVGVRPSGGYSVSIDSVREVGGVTAVEYTETQPGPRCVVTLALTHPYTVVRVPRTETPGEFKGTLRTHNCR